MLNSSRLLRHSIKIPKGQYCFFYSSTIRMFYSRCLEVIKTLVCCNIKAMLPLIDHCWQYWQFSIQRWCQNSCSSTWRCSVKRSGGSMSRNWTGWRPRSLTPTHLLNAGLLLLTEYFFSVVMQHLTKWFQSFISGKKNYTESCRESCEVKAVPDQQLV